MHYYMFKHKWRHEYNFLGAYQCKYETNCSLPEIILCSLHDGWPGPPNQEEKYALYITK